jgi:hypothetical protein
VEEVMRNDHQLTILKISEELKAAETDSDERFETEERLTKWY